MKKTILSLAIVFAAFLSNAQIVAIPTSGDSVGLNVNQIFMAKPVNDSVSIIKYIRFNGDPTNLVSAFGADSVAALSTDLFYLSDSSAVLNKQFIKGISQFDQGSTVIRYNYGKGTTNYVNSGVGLKDY